MRQAHQFEDFQKTDGLIDRAVSQANRWIRENSHRIEDVDIHPIAVGITLVYVVEYTDPLATIPDGEESKS